MQTFLIPDIITVPSKANIKGQDAKHIVKVLRFKKGDKLQLTNGRGKDFVGCITAITSHNIALDIIEGHEAQTEPPINITLCSGMLKSGKMDLIIKHITPLGICRWIPFFCERSIPTPDGRRLQKRLQRWETIAKESIKQCQRSLLPQISSPVTFTDLLEQSSSQDIKIAFWENADQRLNRLKKPVSGINIMILIGPEGGFSKTEIDRAKENGFSSFSLGPRILRAETASISACTLIQHILGDM